VSASLSVFTVFMSLSMSVCKSMSESGSESESVPVSVSLQEGGIQLKIYISKCLVQTLPLLPTRGVCVCVCVRACMCVLREKKKETQRGGQ